MNRACSSESLSSKNSSSPTDFTSDDEFFIDDDVGSSSRNTSKQQAQSNSSNLNDKPQSKFESVFNDLWENKMFHGPNLNDIILNSPRFNPSSTFNQNLLSNYSNNHNVLMNEVPIERVDCVRPRNSERDQRLCFAFQSSKSAIKHCVDDDDENIENIVESKIQLDESNDFHLTGRSIADGPQLNPVATSVFNTNRGLNKITIRMCAKLVECRNLIKAIEFVEQNRDTIDDLTRIITRDAPAFRNYDMNNYHIDYSIKESFNTDFWLDREPIVTTADGNCQYHAVSLSLTGSELYTPEVRLATAVAVIDNRGWFDSILKMIDGGTVLDLVHTIARAYSWGSETTLKAIAVAINKRIFLYTCNIGKKDYELVKSLNKDDLIDAFREKKYRGGTGIHTYADPLVHVPADDYIMLFHKSEHFIAVLPTNEHPTLFEPYNPIVPVF